jgi:hypothetical protein
MVAPLFSLKIQKFDPHAFMTETCMSSRTMGKWPPVNYYHY